MKLSRRAVLAGGAALLAAPLRAQETRAALDAAAAERDPRAALRLLDGLDGLDVQTARAGLRIDADLASAEGPARYALQIQRTVGNGYTAEAARARLGAELDRLHRRAARLFDRIGISGPTVGARYSRLWQDERYLYSDDDQGRAKAVADMNATLDTLRPRVPRLIAGVPDWCLAVDVRALTVAEIAAGKQGGRDLPTPNARGAYIVDLKDIRRRPSWTLPSVAAHELLPGHAVQLPLEAIAAPHPLRLRYASAFMEGWANYAEALAAKDGAFPDPRAALGHIHWLLFRVTRGLADVMIHGDGQSTDAARAKLVAWQGEPAYFAPFEIDLPRIAREPGVRAAEALSWLAIEDRFTGASDRRALHKRLLALGRMRTESFVTA